MQQLSSDTNLEVSSSHHSTSSNSSGTITTATTSDSLKSDIQKQPSIVSEEDVKEKVKERLTQYRKTVLKGMVLSDQLDMRDPQSLAEYAQEIYESMKNLED